MSKSSRTFYFLLFSPFPPKAHERHGKEQLDAKARLLERHVEEQQDVFHPPPRAHERDAEEQIDNFFVYPSPRPGLQGGARVPFRAVRELTAGG